MARLPRLNLAGQLHHVLLRGHNGQPVFMDDGDRRLLLGLMSTNLLASPGVELHAWSLPTEQVQLLLTPRNDQALPRFMQALARSYVQAYNRRHGRSGTLWDGRYRSTVLQPDPWMMGCMVWMDALAAVGLPATPEPLLWRSSAAHYLGLRVDKALTVPPQYWALGNTPFAREAAYRTLVERGLDPAARQALAEAALKGWPLGDAAFVASLQDLTPRRLQKGKPGRPVKPTG